jgi:hypothetical protein
MKVPLLATVTFKDTIEPFSTELGRWNENVDNENVNNGDENYRIQRLQLESQIRWVAKPVLAFLRTFAMINRSLILEECSANQFNYSN